MSGMKAATLYNAIKLHFSTESYDFFHYNGKTKSKFITQAQSYIFDKLYKRYGEGIQDFYVANFTENPKIWVNELLSEDAYDRYKKYLKKKESLTYLFKSDIIQLIAEFDDLNSILKFNKDIPILMKLVLREKVNIETLIILNSLLGFFPVWDKKLDDDIIWLNLKLKCLKLKGFMNFDIDKMRQILVTEIKNRK